MASSKDGVETSEVLKEAKEFKAQGTKFQNEGKFKAASEKYQMILDTLEGKEMGAAPLIMTVINDIKFMIDS